MSFIFLQAEAKGGFFADPMNMVLISATLFIFYFFMLRPNSKKAKQAKEMLESMEKGYKVVTTGGIHGKVNRVNETTIDIQVSTNSIITVEKSAISTELTAAANKSVEEKK